MSTQPVEPTPAPAYTRPTVVQQPTPRAGMGSLALRIGLTLLGAGGLIFGSLMDWLRTVAGTNVAVGSFWGSPGTTEAFLRSAGFVTIVLGLLAIVGLAPRSGWLTRLAGALGLVAAIMVVIQVYRAPGPASIGDLGIGYWLVVAGSIVALVGGFMGTRYHVAYTAPASTGVETAP
jgi:hypothetical protein